MMPVVTSHSAHAHNDPGVQRILASLDQLKSKVDGCDLDLAFLRDIFSSNDVQSLIKVHQKVTTPEVQEQKALTENALEIAQEVSEDLEYRGVTNEAKELFLLLCKPHVRGLLHAHDKVAAKDFMPHLPDIPHEVDEDEESVKIVRLVKGTHEPLGATIRLNEKTGAIEVARIMHGGAADRSGLVHIGDEVQEVNGLSVRGKEPNEVVKILTDSLGPIILKLVPGDNDLGLYRESKMRVRAHFGYDPTDDKLIPCKEAGLGFKKGDILHIVSQDDNSWWQARREGDRNMRAGLIPGKLLMERKLALESAPTKIPSVEMSPKSNKVKPAGKFSPKLPKKSKKTKKHMYHLTQNEDYDSEEIVTYEEVEKYYPRNSTYRPIVLIGAPGVGRNELKRRLIATNPAHFKATIPHTSRPKRPSEIDGEEYIFVPRHEMEKEIQNKSEESIEKGALKMRFVEFGEYKGNLYGTSMESIKSVVNAGHVCVLCPHPQALKLLRTPEIKPFIVFIKPPSIERLRETRAALNAKSAFDENARPFTEDEFQEMLSATAKLEASYSHFFDQILINDDLQKTVNELCAVTHNIETEPQWVPASWVR